MGPPPGDAGDGGDGCPPGFVDADGNPANGCEYECTRTADRREICDGYDNDCDPSTPDGSGEASLDAPCDGPDLDRCQEGVFTCTGGALVCNDATGDTLDVCDGIDNDCNPATSDGTDDEVGVGCDGDDADLCAGGFTECVGGAIVCNDSGGPGLEICDGVDNDCDAATADGSADPMLGMPCDGADTDLCAEGTYACTGGALVCNEPAGDAVERCDGLDNDCNPATPDGAGEAGFGTACDGADTDLCAEGTWGCNGTALVCSDTTGGTVDLCDGVDNDCDPSTADGAGAPTLGDPCDGADTDACEDGTIRCGAAGLYCDDPEGASLELCDGVDNDCDPGTADGVDDTRVGVPCDGSDSDLCEEGTTSCMGGVVRCSDTTGNTLDLCNGMDDDCNPATADGADDPTLGDACDGVDTDLCPEGVRVCMAGTMRCNDTTGNTLDLCNGMDDDCNPATPDGDDDSSVGVACDGGDPDLCQEGAIRCTGGLLACDDMTGPIAEVCDGVDNDCDPATPDGLDDPAIGDPCDGADLDSCVEGVYVCSGGALACNEPPGDSLEVCNAMDDDCDGLVDEGTGAGPETCDGVDNDCDGSIDEGNPCTGCTTRVSGGRVYQFCTTAATWTAARDACLAVGYHLVQIDNATENSFVKSTAMAADGGSNWWIGLNDRATDGTYVWTNGTTDTGYRDWASGSTGSLTRDCVELSQPDSFQWDRADCGNSTPYVCER